MIQGYYAKRQWVLRKEKVIPYLLKAGYVDCWQEVRRLRQSSVAAAAPPASSPGHAERPDGSSSQPATPETSAATPAATNKDEKSRVYLEQVRTRRCRSRVCVRATDWHVTRWTAACRC
jgi:hypothetical protein